MEEIEKSNEQLIPVFRKRATNYQPNFFTESRQEFTELEKKIVTLVINQVGHLAVSNQVIRGSDLVITVPFSELTRNHHKQIADAAESLQSKRLIYRNDLNQQLDIITPFPRVRFDIISDRRVIELTMFSAVVPHFAELGQRYTKYDINAMLSLSSVYSQRMFEIISMYINKGQQQFSYNVARLMEMLDCSEKYNFNDFRKNVLVVAQRELSNKIGINLDWVSRKEGKKIVELIFSIKTDKQIAIAGIKKDQQTINSMSVNEAVVTAWQLMKAYKLKDWQKDLIASDRELLEIFYRVDSELANGLRTNIKNPTAYLVKSLGIDQVKAPASRTKEPRAKSVTATIKTDVPAARKGTTQLVGDLFGDIIGSK